MTRSQLRKFLTTWVIPPGAAAAWRSARLPKLQKFWRGAPVPAPPFEAAFFQSADLTAVSITRDDDTRPAAEVSSVSRLPLPANAAGQAVQFAVTPVRAGESVRFTAAVGNDVTTHTGLSAAAWLDVRMNVPDNATSLELSATEPVFVSAPRAVRLRPTHATGARHVVVLVLDGWTTRISAERHPTQPCWPVTPNIERFFQRGFHAPLGYSNAEWTMPTVGSVFTGVYPTRHRAFRPYAQTTLPEDRELLAERFQREGFHTLCMSVANRLTPAYGHHRGFDRFVYHFPEPGFTTRAYDPAVWLADLVGHLDAHRHDRTFSYVHLPDVHPVWEIPPATRAFNLARRGTSTGLDLKAVRGATEAGEQGRQLYLLRLHEIDRLLASVFDFIDRELAEQALVVLTADHGTPWPYVRAARPKDEPYLVDDRTAVSFRMRGPGVPDRSHTGLTAPNIDLLPTLYALCGFDIPADIDGRNLLAADYGRDVVLSESVYGGVYEVAAHGAEATYIEKYPIDETHVRVTGPASYARLFPAQASDYSRPLDSEPGRLRDSVHAHMARCGLTPSAA